MQSTIIPINTGHTEDCIKIFLESYNCPPWNYKWTTKGARQYLSDYINNPTFAGFILYSNNQAVGAVFGHKKLWWTNQQLMIDEFFISSNFQNMGFGKQLLNYVSDYASGNSLELLVLMTNKYMPAYNFYKKLQFTDAEQYVFMFKTTEPS